MKAINKFIIPFTTVLLILMSIWLVTITITGSKWYYNWQFKKNNTVSQLTWRTTEGETIRYDEEDLDLICTKIIDYLFNREESMQVIIDGKMVFSNQALKHMKDVKTLYNLLNICCIIFSVIFCGCLVYIIRNFKNLKMKMFRQTIITYSVIGVILLVICLLMIIDFDWTFTNFHHIIFPNKESFDDAFFGPVSNYPEAPYINNMLLVTVLSIEVFSDAAWIIISFVLLVMVSWFMFTKIKSKQARLK